MANSIKENQYIMLPKIGTHYVCDIVKNLGFEFKFEHHIEMLKKEETDRFKF